MRTPRGDPCWRNGCPVSPRLNDERLPPKREPFVQRCIATRRRCRDRSDWNAGRRCRGTYGRDLRIRARAKASLMSCILMAPIPGAVVVRFCVAFGEMRSTVAGIALVSTP